MDLFIATYVIWLISEIALNRMLHSNSTDKQGADKNSLLIIWVIIVTAVTGAVFIANKFAMPISANGVIKYVGLGVILCGVVLRIIAIRTLGKFFTVDVTIRQNHQLVKNGMYKYFRHPSYTASLLSFIGFGLSLNNWYSLLIIVATIVAVFTMRIRIEERALTTQFGEQYLQYKKQAWGLVPFIH